MAANVFKPFSRSEAGTRGNRADGRERRGRREAAAASGTETQHQSARRSVRDVSAVRGATAVRSAGEIINKSRFKTENKTRPNLKQRVESNGNAELVV